MRTLLVGVVLSSLTLSSAAQLSPEEAQAKLAQRDAARKAERERKVEITAGELADLKARIAQLEAENAALKNQRTAASAAAKPAPRKTFEEIEVGMSKDDVLAFIKQREKSLRVTAKNVTANRETLKIARLGYTQKQTGTQRNSLGRTSAVYSDVERIEGYITVTLTDGAVSEVAAK